MAEGDALKLAEGAAEGVKLGLVLGLAHRTSLGDGEGFKEGDVFD